MKRLIIFLLFSVFLCGCSSNKTNFPVFTDSLSFTAQIEGVKTQYSVEIQNGETTIKADEIKLHFSGDTALISLDKLEYKTKISALPEGIFIDFIHTVFLDATKNKSEINCKNNEFFIEGKTEKYEYKIYFGSSGLPIKIIDSKNDITVLILNAKVL